MVFGSGESQAGWIAVKKGAEAPFLDIVDEAGLQVVDHARHDDGQNDRRADDTSDRLNGAVHLSPNRVCFNHHDNRQTDQQRETAERDVASTSPESAIRHRTGMTGRYHEIQHRQ